MVGHSWLTPARLQATATQGLPETATLMKPPVYVDLLLEKGGEAADDVPMIARVLTDNGWFDMQLAGK